MAMTIIGGRQRTSRLQRRLSAVECRYSLLALSLLSLCDIADERGALIDPQQIRRALRQAERMPAELDS